MKQPLSIITQGAESDTKPASLEVVAFPGSPGDHHIFHSQDLIPEEGKKDLLQDINWDYREGKIKNSGRNFSAGCMPTRNQDGARGSDSTMKHVQWEQRG